MNNYTILSENSSDHWPHFNVQNKNVLDIGCGIWYTEDMEETSPIYFAKTANFVVGVDSNINDISRYESYTEGDNKFKFITHNITDATFVRNLLQEHNITALKCDIEGHEIHLLDLTSDDMDNITDIAIEFHTDELKDRYMKKIPEWGFNIHCVANFINTPSNLGVIFAAK
jgi:SAM-dependent methyltransferase